MPEPAFLVEGMMEKRIVEGICAGKVVRLIGCNGKQVTMEAIGKRVIAHLRMLRGRYHPVVIVFDREKRPESCEHLVSKLKAYLAEQGFVEGVAIAIADRSTECWFLADWEYVARRQGFAAQDVGDVEGALGKAAIRRLLPQSIVYNEVIHGAEFFLAARPDVMYSRSISFKAMIDACSLNCDFVDASRRV